MVYFFGDVHLKENRNNIDWEFNGKRLLDFFRELPLSCKDSVFFLGDFFDKTVHHGNINKLAIDIIMYLTTKVGSVTIISGNHENSIYSGSNLEIFKSFEKVSVIDNISIVDCACLGNILICPFIPKLKNYSSYLKKVEEVVKDIDVSFILGHHFFQENAVYSSPYLDLDSVIKQYDYWIMGHNHKFEQISDKKICLGAMWPTDKSQKDYCFSYATYEDKNLNIVSIPNGFFRGFSVFDWEGEDGEYESNIDFSIVRYIGSKVDRFEEEKKIYSVFKDKNLYEIIWDFEEKEEDKDDMLLCEKEEDLIDLFFRENNISSEIKTAFLGYLE